MLSLQKSAGLSAIAEGFIYIVAFVYFGVFWHYPVDASAVEQMTYLAENHVVFSMIYVLIYVVFGVLLAVLVTGLYDKFRHHNNPLATIGSLFGVIWVGLVIASGMITNIGLAQAIKLLVVDPEKALELWRVVSVITESLGGGNELVGGMWVLLISIAANQQAVLPRKLNYLGYVVGVAGIATIYPAEIFTEIFGITQIVWFIWLGGHCLRAEKRSEI